MRHRYRLWRARCRMTRATALGASIATNLLWRPTSSRRSRLRYVLAGAGSATSGGARNAPPWTTRKGELVVPRDGTLPKTRVALDKDQVAAGAPPRPAMTQGRPAASA